MILIINPQVRHSKKIISLLVAKFLLRNIPKMRLLVIDVVIYYLIYFHTAISKAIILAKPEVLTAPTMPPAGRY